MFQWFAGWKIGILELIRFLGNHTIASPYVSDVCPYEQELSVTWIWLMVRRLMMIV